MEREVHAGGKETQSIRFVDYMVVLGESSFDGLRGVRLG